MLRKFAISAMCATMASFGAANAGVITVTGDSPVPGTPDLSVGPTTLSITGEFVDDEAINFSQEFLAGAQTGSASIDIGIIDADGTPAGFDNLVMEISSAAGVFSFQITEDVATGAGAQILIDAFSLLTANDVFTIAITGNAFNPGTSRSFFSINFSANPIPLPAAAPLLLAGLGGLFAASRKKTVAVA